jgi:hypothetical protein
MRLILLEPRRTTSWWKQHCDWNDAAPTVMSWHVEPIREA